jgi:hypothetical protein
LSPDIFATTYLQINKKNQLPQLYILKLPLTPEFGEANQITDLDCLIWLKADWNKATF